MSMEETLKEPVAEKATVRIEKESISVIPTEDPLVYVVRAEVTKDDIKVENPVLYPVEFRWNVNTGDAGILAKAQEALSKLTPAEIETNIKTSLGESIRKSEVVEPEPEPANYTIYANTVTVNQLEKVV
jgi:hypothetical protein